MKVALSPEFLDAALDVARAAAAAAAKVIRPYYRSRFELHTKADSTPVTQADIEAEAAIRAVLSAAYPGHAIYGEEQGRDAHDSDFLWLVDPIDGTKSFVRGYPMFSTQIALMHRGALVLGVSCASEFGQTAWARIGGGAFLEDSRFPGSCSEDLRPAGSRPNASHFGGSPLDGAKAAAPTAGVTPHSIEQLRVAATGRIEDAAISTGNLKSLARGPRWAAFGELLQQANRGRGYGDFYHYHLLAQGSIDAVIESDVNILDIAALAVIVREAGGIFTDLDGAEPDLDTRSVLAAVPALHAGLRARFDAWH